MVLFLTRTLCVKYGPLRHLPEASTMEYIAGNRYFHPDPRNLLRIHSQRLDIYCYAKSPAANVLLIAGSPDRRSLRQESYNSVSK